VYKVNPMDEISIDLQAFDTDSLKSRIGELRRYL